MEFTERGLWTLIHGLGFGSLYLLTISGALSALWRVWKAGPVGAEQQNHRGLGIYLAVMAALAWLAVQTGTYIVYPWYRIPAPAGAASLSAYPRALLLASPATSGWHLIGMEWKEHVAWLVPIAMTMTAAVVIRYRRDLSRYPQLRSALCAFVIGSLLASGVAGFLGAMINKKAPLEGGKTINLLAGVRP